MPTADRSLRFLAAAAAVACPVFLAGLYVDSFWVRLPAKPWPHLALLAWVLARASGAYARRIAAALALCMVADVLLEFRETLFVHGMATFLVGQLTLASAFTLRCRSARPAAALPFAAWLGTAFFVVSSGLGALLVPVVAYMTAIGLMLWRAAAWFTQAVFDQPAAAGEQAAARLALAGAVVFGISDTVIALDRFHAPVAGARYFIILTYWAALALLAASAVQPKEGH